MLKQYSILTKCLSVLKKSDLPIIEKLKIEVQLIQTKRLLLDYNVEQKVTGVIRSEREFNDLYEELRQVCGSGGGELEMVRLKNSLLELREALDSVPRSANLTPGQFDTLKARAAVHTPRAAAKGAFN